MSEGVDPLWGPVVQLPAVDTAVALTTRFRSAPRWRGSRSGLRARQRAALAELDSIGSELYDVTVAIGESLGACREDLLQAAVERGEIIATEAWADIPENLSQLWHTESGRQTATGCAGVQRRSYCSSSPPGTEPLATAGSDDDDACGAHAWPEIPPVLGRSSVAALVDEAEEILCAAAEAIAEPFEDHAALCAGTVATPLDDVLGDAVALWDEAQRWWEALRTAAPECVASLAGRKVPDHVAELAWRQAALERLRHA